MTEIIIECAEMDSLKKAYTIIGKTFGAGNGVITDSDSLYDYLMTIDTPTEITFEDVDLLDVYLGEEGVEILETFERASEDNDRIELI